MFTGIVQGLGRLTGITALGGEYRLTVEAQLDWGSPLEIGESIAVSGACLTVVEAAGRSFAADASAETIARTTMRNYRAGTVVNLERALRLSDRLGGHLVSGHVDAEGVIKAKREMDRSTFFRFGLDKSQIRYVIEKGSVAIDGVSLTVNEVRDEDFSVNVIPHTALATTLGFKKPGDYVNVETDLIGKYVARFLGRDTEKSKIDVNFLAEHGFL